MRIVADTNLLVRPLVADEPRQAQLAVAAIEAATVVAAPLAVFCEFAWVLRRIYRIAPERIGVAIRGYLAMPSLRTDRTAVEAGLAQLDAGGDFADGAIAHAGRLLGGEVFVTFDRRAERLLRQAGHPTRLLETPPQP